MTTTAEIITMLTEIDAIEAAERDELPALQAEIAALARILGRRVPAVWRRQATETTDEPGHWDNSYPPDEHWAALTAERLLVIYDATTTQRATSSGSYYSYVVRTTEAGLAVDRAGRLYTISEGGSAAVGQYAARPGTDSRDLTTDYRQLSVPSLAQCRAAAAELRDLLDAVTARGSALDAALCGGDMDVRVAAIQSPHITNEQLQRAVRTGGRRPAAEAKRRLAKLAA